MLNSAEIRHSVCASTLPQTWALDLDVIAQNGFSGQVAFESGTLPNGVSIGFAPSQVSVPGSTTATLQLGTAVPSGQHTITLVGTSGSSSKAFGVRLGIIDGAVAQLAPSDQATGIGIAPAFIRRRPPVVFRVPFVITNVSVPRFIVGKLHESEVPN